MYKILFSQIALKKLKRLPKRISLRIISALERIRLRPEKYVKKLVGLPFWKLRVGEYRVILQIEPKEKKIVVLTLDHRKKVYRSLYKRSKRI